MAGRAVPRTSQVVPGAAVSIVLKADQPTGREVQGVVKDVLTRGDHPRGIKVRMTDGRIGRVQRMDAGAVAGGILPSDGELAGGTRAPPFPSDPPAAGAAVTPRAPSRRQHRFRDVRLDEPEEAPPEQIGLDAYIVAPKRKGKGRNAGKSTQAGETTEDRPGGAPSADDVSSTLATCPVCGVFEGDEIAVAHHVSQHFE